MLPKRRLNTCTLWLNNNQRNKFLNKYKLRKHANRLPRTNTVLKHQTSQFDETSYTYYTHKIITYYQQYILSKASSASSVAIFCMLKQPEIYKYSIITFIHIFIAYLLSILRCELEGQ